MLLLAENSPPIIVKMKDWPDMPAELIDTKAAFARRLNVSASYISSLVKSGLPVTAEGMVRVDAALKWIRANVNNKPGRPVGSVEGARDAGDLTAAKTKLILLQAERAALEISARRRELVPVEEARRAASAVTRTTRDMFLNFSTRHGAQLAGKFGLDPGAFIGALESHIREALNEAASRPPDFEDGK